MKQRVCRARVGVFVILELDPEAQTPLMKDHRGWMGWDGWCGICFVSGVYRNGRFLGILAFVILFSITAKGCLILSKRKFVLHIYLFSPHEVNTVMGGFIQWLVESNQNTYQDCRFAFP